MKHFAINSFSTTRAALDCIFLIIFFLLVPFFPPFLNLRILSLLRLRFSILAFTRLASREVVDVARVVCPTEGTTNAFVVDDFCAGKWGKILEIVIWRGINRALQTNSLYCIIHSWRDGLEGTHVNKHRNTTVSLGDTQCASLVQITKQIWFE